jgi:hypothetical protein
MGTWQYAEVELKIVAVDISTPQEHRALEVSIRFLAVMVISIPPIVDIADGNTEIKETSGTYV